MMSEKDIDAIIEAIETSDIFYDQEYQFSLAEKFKKLVKEKNKAS